MRTKSFYTLELLIVFCSGILWCQQIPTKNVDTPLATEKSLDSLEKEPLLLDKVRYTAKQKVNIDRRENKLYLIDEAELYYQDITLRAGLIVLDYRTKDVYAGRIEDSLGNLSQFPYFKQGPNEVNPDSIRYNFETQKALIWNSKTAQSGMNVFSEYTKKENDSVFYLSNAKLTTAGDLESADYYFKARKAKLIPGGKIVTGMTNMFISNVPTPIGLPFSYFPSKQQGKDDAPAIGPSDSSASQKRLLRGASSNPEWRVRDYNSSRRSGVLEAAGRLEGVFSLLAS